MPAVVDDMIDLVNTQEGLQNVFSSLLSGSESRMSPEEQGEVIASRVAPELEAKPALRQVRTWASFDSAHPTDMFRHCSSTLISLASSSAAGHYQLKISSIC